MIQTQTVNLSKVLLDEGSITQVADESREFFKDKQLKMNLIGSRLLALEKNKEVQK